ncbi:MAG: DUF6507 family protein [Propionibacteriaceae bacterium]|nr:DUF6507 family protein [Propionibacteriaceae bacterium]
MARWDINPGAVNRVLSATYDAGQEIEDALNGGTGDVPTGLYDTVENLHTPSQSTIVFNALAGFLDDRSAAISEIVTQIIGVMKGTVSACNAISAGHTQMAAKIQTQMSQACDTGNFDPFVKP